jgi:hypothetical protein
MALEKGGDGRGVTDLARPGDDAGSTCSSDVA